MRNAEVNMKKLLEYIKKYSLEKGYAPNIREMADHVGVKSTCTIVYYLRRMEEKHQILRTAGKNRAILYLGSDGVFRNGFSLVNMPLLKDINDDMPILSEENMIDSYTISQNLFNTTQPIFMINVVGDSMKDAGIDDGDTIIAKLQTTAENGEIVVAKTNIGITIKRFYKEIGCYRLQPQNPSHLPILVDDVKIIGKVIGCLKRYDQGLQRMK